MKYSEKSKATLVLEDGSVFEGKALGFTGTTSGEIAFNTGMTGYQEIFTDPSYYGQMLVMTTPHIGNYGVNEIEVESDQVNISGLICNKFSDIYSRTAANESLQDYFERNKLVGISDIDTRALVRHIRQAGAMNCIISNDGRSVEELKQQLKSVPSMDGLELASKVSCKEPFFFGNENAELKVAVMDFGVKTNILRCLVDRGCYLKVFPYNTSYEEMKKWNPDGFMLSNGPGDPSALPEVKEVVNQIIEENNPTFGICLGHQMMSLASGLTTKKMFNGHRGINHPVKNHETGKGEITSQNHGFVVDMEQAKSASNIEVTHTHLNDGTLAGMKRTDKNAFSVQYHPEASAGPHDSRYLFDEFVTRMKSNK
ncbi:MAG: glutamine-hydrolyzing carbamoyl-phosphate synthase small subunit [Salibacteraceae bacterium]